jgi:hypothetical protein
VFLQQTGTNACRDSAASIFRYTLSYRKDGASGLLRNISIYQTTYRNPDTAAARCENLRAENIDVYEISQAGRPQYQTARESVNKSGDEV